MNQHRDSTQKCYYSIWKNFNEFFVQLDKKPSDWADRLTLFVGYLIQRNYQSTTVHSYVCAIKAVLKMNKIKIAEDQYLLASLTRACHLKNDQIQTRLPIGKGMLCILLKTVDVHFNNRQQPYLASLYAALLSTAYFGLFRVGELTMGTHAVKAGNVHVGVNKKKMLFVLCTSKTHGKHMPPQQIKIAATPNVSHRKKRGGRNWLESNGSELPCPFHLLRSYIAYHGGFRSNTEPFFIFRDGSPVQPKHMRSCLKLALMQSGFEAQYYGTHGLWAGRSCDLFKLGIPVESIKKLGRWHSNAIFRYLKY